jgi:hypothetical protein
MVYGNFKPLAYGILEKSRYGIRHIQFEICQNIVKICSTLPQNNSSHVVIFINLKSAYVFYKKVL